MTAHRVNPGARTGEHLSPDQGGTEGRWLATLAHELRSPLGAVLLALDELGPACAHEPCARAAREAAERGSRSMARIIEDVLALCRGARGAPAAHGAAPVDLGRVVADAVAVARPVLDGRRHRVSVVLPASLPAVAGHASRLEQVLVNLLTNAAKFTAPGGSIAVRVESADGAVTIRVRDDGMGIAPDLLSRVFDPYCQGPAAADGPHAGLGIGLAVVKSLVELHGGSVSAHSDGPGTGAEFVVVLPARASP